ncbi:MAG: hypothetical protein LBL83_04285, partial [Clostridiales bacterium]|nr:hypothetical protein [Clostridiales bacterium]
SELIALPENSLTDFPMEGLPPPFQVYHSTSRHALISPLREKILSSACNARAFAASCFHASGLATIPKSSFQLFPTLRFAISSAVTAAQKPRT